MSDRYTSASFAGTKRFEIKRELGEGAMGAVYAAFDRENDTMVALKVLNRVDGEALLRFKREFRAVQDLAHPNVVSLGELVESEGAWFFTMELIDGVDFLTYVRPTGELDEERLRAALGQLALALDAFHGTGHVHRDVKPRNTLVTRDDRVVLLDFGLTTRMEVGGQSSEAHIVGTAAYMAPEQAVGAPVDASADWYAFGTLLYEALTGRLPFSGTGIEVMMDKQRHRPPPPRALVPRVPADLDELCVHLLEADPEKRPSGRSVLKRLGVAPDDASATTSSSSRFTQSTPFVGREAELSRLRRAFDECREAPLVAIVRGESGLGKSELVREFADRLKQDWPEVVVLAGRCYERESVAYKAFDGIADSLSRYMRHLPKVEAAALLPRYAGLLPRLFPSLQRVEVISQSTKAADIPDRHELRHQMFAAFRELFARLAMRRPVVLAIDDLQWTDDDSLELMKELFAGTELRQLIVVATMRPVADRARRDAIAAVEDRARGCIIDLAPLPDDDASELAALLLPKRPQEAISAIVAEAQGHPLFLQELARHEAMQPGGARASLDETLWARIASMPDESRRLLAMVSVAGSPIAQEVAASAAEMDYADYLTTASLLRIAYLLRSEGMRRTDHVSVYHDRIRELVSAHLEREEKRHHHERLAIALESTGGALTNPYALVRHAEAAGARGRAAAYAEVAAQHAVEAVAFDRAVEFFQTSLRLGEHDEDKAITLRLRLAEALASAGRGLEAAETYIEAGAAAKPSMRLECQRQAAEQLLKSGHIDRGVAAIDDLLRQIGIRRSSATLTRFLLSRARLRLTRLRYRVRDEAEIAPQVLRRLDVLWSATLGTVMADHMRSADLQTRHLILSLKAGEPHRLARAFAVEAGIASSAGPRARRRVDRLLAHTEALNEPLEDRYLEGWISAIRGLAAYQRGEFREAIELCDAAAATWTPQSHARFFTSSSVAFFERTSVSLYSLWSLYYLGRYREVRRRAFDILEGARRRGDRYTETNTSTTVTSIAWLVADEVEQAMSSIETVQANWSQTGFHLQHYWAMVSRVQIALYRGQGEDAWAVISDTWRRLKRSFMPIVAVVGVEAWDLRARAAAAAGLTVEAKHAAGKLRRQRLPHAIPIAALVDAAARFDEGDREGCVEELTRARSGFAKSELSMHEAVTKWCLGVLIGGDKGQELVAEALEVMESQGVRCPEKIVRLLAPGLGPKLQS